VVKRPDPQIVMSRKRLVGDEWTIGSEGTCTAGTEAGTVCVAQYVRSGLITGSWKEAHHE
jgi:hypothetical protein